jgi:hypothetical protein
MSFPNISSPLYSAGFSSFSWLKKLINIINNSQPISLQMQYLDLKSAKNLSKEKDK